MRAFLGEALDAFLYPLSARGVLMIVPAAGFLAIVHYVAPMVEGNVRYFGQAVALLVFLAILVSCYVADYLFNVIRFSAGGERKMPDWPLVDYDRIDALVTLFWGLSALAVSFAPLLIYRYIVHEQGTEPAPAVLFALRAAGCLYLPMSLLAVVLLRTPWGLSPHVVVPALLKVPFAAGLAGLLLWGVWTLGLSASEAILARMSESNPVLAQIAARTGMFAVGLYLLFVVARIIGITHRVWRERIGWIERD
jgi:hypothetical protein